jgi:hypothetical protein
MRHMSFQLTTEQMRARTKTVTRRLGWRDLQPGTVLQAVEKCQGLRKGERVQKLGVIRVVNVRREYLTLLLHKHDYAAAEMVAEGFPGMDGRSFVEMFCRANNCFITEFVTRIEFEHVPVPEQLVLGGGA